MKRKHSIFTIVIALVLTAVMVCLPQVQTLAATVSTEYISDIQIGYGDSGKQALKDAGYTVWEELNANEGGNGSAVWIGYKTTLDENEAITDIATMNMTGGYSFEAYKEELAEISANVDYMLSSFKATIAEFRENYNAKSKYALKAYEMLNKIKEDDTDKLLGDLMVDESTSDDTLHTIFMQGNSEVLNYVYTALVLGCTEYNGETFLTRLEAAEYNEEISASANRARTQVANNITDFKAQLSAAKANHEGAEEAGDEATYLETLAESERAEAAYYLSLYDVTNSIQYGNLAELMGVESFTLYDAMMLSTEYTSDEELVLDDYIIDMLANVMTEGQIGSIGCIGLATIIMNAYHASLANNSEADSDELDEYFEAIDKNLAFFDGFDAISVYIEVDRTLFSDVDTVALTSQALRDKAASSGASFGKKTITDWRDNATVRVSLAALSGATGAIAIGCGVFTYFAKGATVVKETVVTVTKSWVETAKMGFKNFTVLNDTYYDTAREATRALQEYIKTSDKAFSTTEHLILDKEVSFPSTETVAKYSSNLMKGFTVVTTVAAIACLVLTVMTLITYLHKPEETIVYTKIPRVIVDLRYDENGDKAYYNYYAAKLVTAEEGETDSLKLYGDLNGLNNKDEWVVLYFSKDARLGNGLTADILVKNDVSNLTLSETNDYSTIHDFSSLGAADLNKYNTNSNAKKLYVLVKLAEEAEDTTENTGSLFSKNTVITSLITLVAGAGIATLVTAIVMKKARKN